MNREQLLTAVLAVLIVVSFYQTIQLKDLSGKIKGDGTAAAEGETYEEMMERMHGSDSGSSGSSAASAAASSAGAGMVGGC